MTTEASLTKALEFFKDWSNYLLVTTVAALGWVASGEDVSTQSLKVLCIWSLALSIIFGIFTLALIPLVQEQRSTTDTSNYNVPVTFWAWWPSEQSLGLKPAKLIYVCLPQHVLFIVGILLYALGTTIK